MPEHYLSRPVALTSVYVAAIRFIQAVLDHDMQTPILEFCTSYILRNLILSLLHPPQDPQQLLRFERR